MRGVAGDLDALAGEPIIAGQGKAADLGERGMWLCPAPRCSLVAGRRLAAVIPSGFPRLLAAVAWGGPRRAAGSIRGAAAPPGGGGQTCGRSRAARVRACSPGLLRERVDGSTGYY